MHYIYEHVNQFYNFKGLHEFKEKFHPELSPRSIVYSGAANLAAVWLAVVPANAGDSLFGEGFRILGEKVFAQAPSEPGGRVRTPVLHPENPGGRDDG